MTDASSKEDVRQGLEGRAFRPRDRSELFSVIDSAFDYRGDVTVVLTSGEKIVGYVFNRKVDAEPAYLDIFPAGKETSPRRILCREVQALVFSGEDTASGKSWEAWIKKKESERRSEAARIEAEAQARGHL